MNAKINFTLNHNGTQIRDSRRAIVDVIEEMHGDYPVPTRRVIVTDSGQVTFTGALAELEAVNYINEKFNTTDADLVVVK